MYLTGGTAEFCFIYDCSLKYLNCFEIGPVMTSTAFKDKSGYWSNIYIV